MASDTDLDLVFKNAAGKKFNLKIEEPKAGIKKAEIDAAMQVVVENNIFNGFRFPYGAELVFAGAHGKQAGGPDGSHRGTELQHRRPAGRDAEKGGVRLPVIVRQPQPESAGKSRRRTVAESVIFTETLFCASAAFVVRSGCAEQCFLHFLLRMRYNY